MSTHDTTVPNRRYGRTPATAPGPSGAQMLSRARVVALDPLAYLTQMRDRYGPVVQLPIPKPPTYLVSSPQDVRRVLGGAGFDKATIQYRALARVTGPGLLAARARQWRPQRRVVQPAFHQTAIARLAEDAARAATALAVRWDLAPDGSVVDAEDAMARVALEIIGHHLFGERLSAKTAGALVAAVDSVRFPYALAPPLLRSHREGVRTLRAEVDSLVSRRRSVVRDDLLALLLAAYPDDPQAVRDQVITFLVAGHETVATALGWTLALLAGDPQLQEEAARQADHWESTDPLPLIDACIAESLRLYPPAWVISRSADAPAVLGGRMLPAGSLVIISPWVVHRDPDLWPEPHAFRPRRFGSDPMASARLLTARGEYLPFGLGQRMCIGRDAALLEARVVLAVLLSRYRFDSAGPLPRPMAQVSLRPATGLRVRIRRRERS